MDDLTRRRFDANRALWTRLGELIEAWPDQRFGQLLRNFGFVRQASVDDAVVWVDEFSLEPMDLLERVERVSQR